MENWLFAPQSFDLKEARAYVTILLEMYQLLSDAARVDGQRSPDNIRENSRTFSVSLFCLLQA